MAPCLFDDMSGKILHIHLDAIGGVAGDMFVAALLTALPSLETRVNADLAAVLPPLAGHPELERGTSGGIAARRFRLVPPGESGAAPAAAQTHQHVHDPHSHDFHSHDLGEQDRVPDRRGRTSPVPATPVHYGELVSLIQKAQLSAGTAAQALAILRRLAEAEGQVHGMPIEEVHFHEIADWDSLMDVVAAGSIAAALGEVRWSVSDLPRGGGRVRTRHGLMPVPAPATTQLLLGFRLCDDGISGERVTPTGAAILAHLVDPESLPPTGQRLCATGFGAGSRELPGLPNVLRALVWETAPLRTGAGHDTPEEVCVLAFDVDDMTGEEIGVAAERLRGASGVLDLSLGLRLGKKSRPLTEFRLLVAPERRSAVADLCLRETSTIGVRWHVEERRVLTRRSDTAQGPEGPLRRKLVERPDGGTTAKVESDDVAGLEGFAARRAAVRRAEEA